MFDEIFEVSEFQSFKFCINCGTSFIASRKDKKYCSDNCRKDFSRLPQNSLSSPTKARKNAEFFDTARRMGERLYDLPPTARLGFMKELIDMARAGNTPLREILSNWKLRHPHPENDSWMFPRGRRSYSTIAQAAQAYCRKFWGANVDDVVYNRVDEPPTGEI